MKAINSSIESLGWTILAFAMGALALGFGVWGLYLEDPITAFFYLGGAVVDVAFGVSFYRDYRQSR